VARKKFSRKQLLAYTANLQACLIGIEACSGAHFIGAALRNQGHDVQLIPAQFVKPFLKSNKNDFLDAEAIAEAVARQNMRFVPIKTDDQLDLQALHRVRDRLVHRRTAVFTQTALRPINLPCSQAADHTLSPAIGHVSEHRVAVC
jgi:transposase